IVVEVRYVSIPACPIFRLAVLVWMNIGPARGSEHREAFPECPDPINKVLNILRLFSDLIRHMLHRATAAIADVMKLVGKCVFKLLFGLGRVEVEKDGRVSIDLK